MPLPRSSARIRAARPFGVAALEQQDAQVGRALAAAGRVRLAVRVLRRDQVTALLQELTDAHQRLGVGNVDRLGRPR